MNARNIVLVCLLCGFFFSVCFLVVFAWMTDPVVGAMITLLVTGFGACGVLTEWPKPKQGGDQ